MAHRLLSGSTAANLSERFLVLARFSGRVNDISLAY